ncbi:serine hydrolase [Spirosoma rhododendri]|uniref:Serine hydrolase n=2 Tax=Spirosoma rhododendri TaxID=2728024 RepID=A0A7L5DX72_9BACT|nr:serine hydrolase [Spirosoma rhododendri]
MQHPDRYRLQIIYTQIDRDRANKPTFTNYYFNVDSTVYFNPASTVKLPLALLSLEKLNGLKNPQLTRETAMQFDSAHSGQTKEWTDPTAQSGYPSIAHLIRKAMLVSENDPYSRMYEFVGQQAINQSLHAKGYVDTRITHRFVRLTPEQNRHTNPVRFIRPDGSTIYTQPAAYNPTPFDTRRTDTLGIGYYSGDTLIRKPFDFTGRNKLPLESLQQILKSVLFPQSGPARQRFNLTPDDYRFMKQYLSQFPGETNYPKYDSAQYYDSYVKYFFMDSLHHTLPTGVRVFNKVGWAYGFLTDASYVADFTHKVEYMLSATIYVNHDGILNDDKYEYDSIGTPFLYQLGQTIYQHELARKRKNAPDLSAFRIYYEKRQPDNRPTVKDVAN